MPVFAFILIIIAAVIQFIDTILINLNDSIFNRFIPADFAVVANLA